MISETVVMMRRAPKPRAMDGRENGIDSRVDWSNLGGAAVSDFCIGRQYLSSL